MAMPYDNANAASTPSLRETGLSFLVGRARSIANRAQSLRQQVGEKLEPVLLAGPPESNEKVAASRACAPAFNEISGFLTEIEDALESTSRTVARADL